MGLWALGSITLILALLVWRKVNSGSRQTLIRQLLRLEGQLPPKVQKKLAQIEPRQLADIISEVLPDLDRQVRQDLLRFVKTIGLVDFCVQELQSVNEEDRIKACEMLALMEAKEATWQLMEALGDKKPGVSLAAADALGTIKDPEVVAALIDALEKPGQWLPARIAQVLIAQGSLAVKPLLDALSNLSPDGKRMAVQVLAEIRDPQIAPALVKMLEDPAGLVRAEAADALGQIVFKGAIPALIDALGDPVWEVRSKAARSLGLLQAREAVDSLKKACSDQEWAVRANAEKALQQIATV